MRSEKGSEGEREEVVRPKTFDGTSLSWSEETFTVEETFGEVSLHGLAVSQEDLSPSLLDIVHKGTLVMEGVP